MLAPARVPDLGAPPPGSGLMTVLRIAWPVYLGAGLVFLLVTTQATQLPFFLDQLGYHGASGRALITTFAVVATMCGSVSFAVLLGRTAGWRVQAIAIASGTAGLAGFGLWGGGLAAGLALTFMVGLSAGLTIPTLFAAALRDAPEGLRGHSIGLLNVAIFVGSFLSPVVLSPVASQFGYHGLYAVLAAVVLAAGSARVVAMRAGHSRQLQEASAHG